MYNEVLAGFIGNKGICTVGTPQFHGCMTVFFRREKCFTHIALALALLTIVFIQVDFRGIESGELAVIINVAFDLRLMGVIGLLSG